MTRTTKPKEELLESDPEIDKNLRTIKRERRNQKPEPEPKILKALVMANNNNNRPRSLRDYGAPILQRFQSSITKPIVEANNFELKQHGSK